MEPNATKNVRVSLDHSLNVGVRKINSCHITKPMINDKI